MVNIKRVRNLKSGPAISGPVLYWMSRDQRVYDNWALSYAIEMAENIDQPVMVVFALADNYLGAAWRQFHFMLKGLQKAETCLKSLNIPFSVLIGDPTSTIPGFIRQHHISRIVTDFDPLRIKQDWKKELAGRINIPVDEVDTHNIVPCWIASQKEEFAAYTFRPKITRLLPEFMDEFPPLIPQRGKFHLQRVNWEAIAITVTADHSVRPVEWLTPGEKGASAVLGKFLDERISNYPAKRNDPNANGVSGLSPYMHFGHIAAQRVALEVTKKIPRSENTDAFLEELIVRRELADNFCHYNNKYDKVEGFQPWASATLNEHRSDKREYFYTPEQFELACTHDTLWNAAQCQMMYCGTMNGYMRMYWAKKILEWSSSPEDALRTAIYLNDKYQLDGRDPNGYTGCAWSVGGIHDRAWGEREIFGKIRFMNRKGCERKFDVDRYISRINKVIRAEKRGSGQLNLPTTIT